MEHHANIVPWHMLVAERGIELRWVPLTDDGQLDLSDLPRLLDGAKAFSFTAMSNVLGTITPVQQLCAAAHEAGAIAIVDGCQYVPHNVTDVQAWGADLMAFSSHKMCGPSGLGVLWGREDLLDAMPPFLGGGNMIADVRLDGFTTRSPARQVRGPAHRRSPRSSAWALRSTTCPRSGWPRSAATRWRWPSTPSAR